MNRVRILLGVLALLIILPSVHGQETSQDQNSDAVHVKDKKGHEIVAISPTPTPTEVPLKIQVVISEFDGSKKVSNLPYTLYTVSAGPARPTSGSRQSMRYGVRVPVAVGNGMSFQYENVGTNIDYGAYEASGGDYQLVFTIDRSWLGMPGTDDNNPKVGSVSSSRPLMPTFRDNFTVVLKNGQTVEGVSAVDPVTGHVLKVDVTLTVLK